MAQAYRDLLKQEADRDDSQRSRAVRWALDRIDGLESLCGDAAVEMGVHAEKETLLPRWLRKAAYGEGQAKRSPA